MNLKEIDTLNLFLIIAVPVLSVVVAVTIFILIYKYICKKKPREDQIYLLSRDTDSSNYSNTLTEFDPASLTYVKNDTHLVEKVKNEKISFMKESRETAFVYFQFFVRSNPDRIFKSFEHLPMIGTQIDRNWFLVRESTTENNSEIIRFRLIIVNYVVSNMNNIKQTTKKKDKILDIAEAMLMNENEMGFFLNDLLTSLRHPFLLSFNKIDVNFDKNRILFIQEYSRDGSLRDLMNNTNPTDEITMKNCQLSQQTIKSLPIRRIKEYGKQVLSAMIYLKKKLFFSFDNLHSGNVILAYKKNICLLTGFENEFFFSKTRTDNLNERMLKKISKTYLMRTYKSSNKDELVIRKAENEYELKDIISVLRFGQLILTMCFGFESLDELIPSEKILDKYFNLMNDRSNMNQIKNLIFFIFFNRNVDENNEKLKKKFLIPTLDQIYAHEFFKDVKLNESYLDENMDARYIQFLQYFIGKLELKKTKKGKRKFNKSNKDSFFNSDNLSAINETDREYNHSLSGTFSNNHNNRIESNGKIGTQSATSATTPPPPPLQNYSNVQSVSSQSSPPPPPPPPLPKSLSDSADRSALLSDIRDGLKLKKTITKDRSAPLIF
jgi:hypothetical protein